ncbi:MAG: beta-carotene ketolase, partial [Myxococcota bacterium]
MKSTSQWTGIVYALTIVSAWLGGLVFFLTRPVEGIADVPWVLIGILVQTFLSTGLFITAHDAMHGVVAPGRSRLNDFLGSLS